jgi:uncharacterized tellurite resistance protein B-like protein
MLDVVKRLFGSKSADTSYNKNQNTEHDARAAACALFLEMARIDDTFSDEEMNTVVTLLKDRYGLSPEHADALITEADEELKNSIDYWQFARLINENYSTQEKIQVIELLWRIVFVDGKLDRYEDHLMHKLATLLRLSHKQLIDAKLKARQQP